MSSLNTQEENIPTIKDIAPPPANAVFSLVKIEKVSLPHPFMITPGHVAYAADHCGGMLTTEAIKASRVKCGWRDCFLDVDKHETNLTLFIRVPQNRDLNAVEGLHAYLLAIKEEAMKLGIQGFAFPI